MQDRLVKVGEVFIALTMMKGFLKNPACTAYYQSYEMAAFSLMGTKDGCRVVIWYSDRLNSNQISLVK